MEISIFNSLSNLVLNWADQMFRQVLLLGSSELAWFGILSSIFFLSGRRLSRFCKPDSPYISQAIQITGTTAKLAGFLMITTSLLTSAALITFIAIGYIFSPLTSGMGIAAATALGLQKLWEIGSNQLIALSGGIAAGITLSLPLTIRIIPQWERGPGLPDVEELVKTFKKFNNFDPRRYIKVQRGCFIGRETNGKPIYIPWRKLRETHIQVLGMTGSGKGVAISLITYQCAMAGESVIWFDPKHDRYSPRILQAAAKQTGREFYLLNLNLDQAPQFNILAGTKAFEIEELFVAGFDLRSKGTEGDFHRGKDEDAAIEASRLAIETDARSIPGLFGVCANVAAITEQENFWRHFRKLADLPAVNTEKGLDLVDAISRGAIIYVVGSSDNERVKMLQKMLLVRIMQIIKGRDRLDKHVSTCVVLDEFRHLISPAALTALGVVRDFDAHFLLAHQSLGDLDSCPGIDHAEAYGAVIDNTAIKIIYKLGDGDYAEKLANGSGKRRTYTDNSAKNLDEAGAAAGGWREAQIHHINPDILTHLPTPSDRPKQASVGVLFGLGTARQFYVGPIPVTGPLPEPERATAYLRNMACGHAQELI